MNADVAQAGWWARRLHHVAGFCACRFQAAALWVLVLMFAEHSTARAHPALDAAKAAYDEGNFTIALVHLEDAQRDPKLTPNASAEMLWYRGVCHLAQDNPDAAYRAFDALVRLRPLYQPSRVLASPVQLAEFTRRKELYREAHGVRMGPPSFAGGVLSVPLLDHPAEVQNVVVFIRNAGGTGFHEFVVPAEGASAHGPLADHALWAEAASPAQFEVVLEARGETQAALARRGDASAPETLEVSTAEVVAARVANRPPPPAKPSIHARIRRITLLSVAGATAAGGSVALFLAGAGAVISTASWAALWRLPLQTGTDKDPMFRVLYGAWLSGIVAGAGLTAAAILFATAASGTVALALILP